MFEISTRQHEEMNWSVKALFASVLVFVVAVGLLTLAKGGMSPFQCISLTIFNVALIGSVYLIKRGVSGVSLRVVQGIAFVTGLGSLGATVSWMQARQEARETVLACLNRKDESAVTAAMCTEAMAACAVIINDKDYKEKCHDVTYKSELLRAKGFEAVTPHLDHRK